jgi:Ca2+-binding EF-hand superfamily protein
LTAIDLKQMVIDKIRYQWKTIRKAFQDMNKDVGTHGYISQHELKFYFNHWGLKMSESMFKELFDMLDHDKDGKISYIDFHTSIGAEIAPAENLYFRQELPF